ncbi:MAG: LysM peptidoglycan-binding domain-containing protein [Chloroflexi bacterium]|nr:LysM peptidoglycan-binding domain-containing protein [Chloroflexota bacterium]
MAELHPLIRFLYPLTARRALARRALFCYNTRMKRFVVLGLLLLGFLTPATVHADSPTHIVAYGETLYSIARKYGVSPQALASANGITTQSWVYAGQRLKIPGAASTSNNALALATPASPRADSELIGGIRVGATACPRPFRLGNHEGLPLQPTYECGIRSNGMYVVRAGDTLYSVARKFGVSVNALADANNIPPNGFLYTGWQLKIPGNPPPAPQPDQPTNRPTDYPTNRLSDLSTTYIVQPGDTLYRIAVRIGVTIQTIVIANNLPSQFVYSGQRLTIPGTASNSTPANNSSNAPASNAAVSGGVNVRVTAVPVYRQKQTLTCEESAAAMATFGALDENQIVAAMPRSDNPFEGIRGETNYELLGGLTHYGTYAQGLQKGLAKLGRPSTTYYGQPYEKFKASILENLQQSRPVIWWTTWRESYQKPQWVQVSNGTSVPLTPYEHTVVIVAATDAGITYNDPYDGTVRFTSWANHQRTSSYFNNMALVVY